MRRRQSLVYRVGRATEQPHLLASHHRKSARLTEPPQRFAVTVLRSQRCRQRGPPTIGIRNLPSRRRERRRIVWVIAVKPLYSIEMIAEIGKELRGAGEVCVTDAGWFHAWEVALSSVADSSRTFVPNLEIYRGIQRNRSSTSGPPQSYAAKSMPR